jgi:hypothetical protein
VSTTRTALLATAVTALAVLSACGDDDPPAPADRPAATTPATSPDTMMTHESTPDSMMTHGSTPDSMMTHGSTPDSMMTHDSMAPSTTVP